MKKNSPLSSRDAAGRVSENSPGREAVAWAVGSGRGDDLARRIEKAVKRGRRRRSLVMAGGLAVLLACGGIWQLRHRASLEGAPSLAQTSIVVSSPERQVLPDGSEVELKEGAGIAIEYGPALRRIVLRSGEAHFQVVADPARPFVVAAGGVEVRAVGTAFAVQLGEQAVEVLVTAGKVAVDQPVAATTPDSAPPAPARALAEAGSRVVVEISPRPEAAAPQVSAVSEAELNDRLLWRVPLIEFSGAPLAEVIPIFNRHSHVQLKLDPALGRLQMSGILRVDNTDLLLRLLRNEFGIEVERREGNEIHLRRR